MLVAVPAHIGQSNESLSAGPTLHGLTPGSPCISLDRTRGASALVLRSTLFLQSGLTAQFGVNHRLYAAIDG
jgi:hypothetical protein